MTGSSPAHAASMIGNKNRVALKDPKIKQEAYAQYCKHIAEGWPKQSWYFKHPEYSCTWQTMDKYIQESPAEFNSSLMEEAQAARYQHWFGEGNNLMKGQYKNGSPVVWQTIMRNIFRKDGWDNFEKHEGNEPVNTEKFNKLMDQVSTAQEARKICNNKDNIDIKSE